MREPICKSGPQLENALIVGDPDSPDIGLKLCDFGYSKDELVRCVLLITCCVCFAARRCAFDDDASTCRCTLTVS